MTKPLTTEAVEAAAEGNPHARELVRAVTQVLNRFGGRCADKGKVGPELLSEAALEAVAAAYSHPSGDDEHPPPWAPPRYKLPADREPGATQRMVISGTDPCKLYVTLNWYKGGSPAELLVSKQHDSALVGALLDRLMTAVSIGLQYGIPWDKFASKMDRTNFGPGGMTEDDDPDFAMVSSILDYAFRWATKKLTSLQLQREQDACDPTPENTSDS